MHQKDNFEFFCELLAEPGTEIRREIEVKGYNKLQNEHTCRGSITRYYKREIAQRYHSLECDDCKRITGDFEFNLHGAQNSIVKSIGRNLQLKYTLNDETYNVTITKYVDRDLIIEWGKQNLRCFLDTEQHGILTILFSNNNIIVTELNDRNRCWVIDNENFRRYKWNESEEELKSCSSLTNRLKMKEYSSLKMKSKEYGLFYTSIMSMSIQTSDIFNVESLDYILQDVINMERLYRLKVDKARIEQDSYMMKILEKRERKKLIKKRYQPRRRRSRSRDKDFRKK